MYAHGGDRFHDISYAFLMIIRWLQLRYGREYLESWISDGGGFGLFS
jgi:hypothetical protein